MFYNVPLFSVKSAFLTKFMASSLLLYKRSIRLSFFNSGNRNIIKINSLLLYTMTSITNFWFKFKVCVRKALSIKSNTRAVMLGLA